MNDLSSCELIGNIHILNILNAYIPENLTNYIPMSLKMSYQIVLDQNYTKLSQQ